MARPVRRVEIYEGEQIWLRDQVYMNSGSAMTSTTATSVSLRVYDLSATASEVDSLFTSTFSPTSTVVIALTAWDVDSTGYNVSFKIPSTAFEQQGGHVYGAVAEYSTSTDGTKRSVFEVRCLPVLGV